MRALVLSLLLLTTSIAAAQEPRRLVPRDDVQALSFSADGDELLAGHESGRIVTWDPGTGAEALLIAGDGLLDRAHHLPVRFLGHAGPVVVTGGVEGLCVRRSGEPLRRLKAGNVVAGALSADGGTLALLSADDEGAPRLFTLPLPAADELVEVPLKLRAPLGLAWSPEGARLAIADRDGFDDTGRLVVWNRRTGATEEVIFGGEAAFPIAVTWTPDGEELLVGTARGAVVRVDAASGALGASVQEPGREDLDDPSRSIRTIALSPDGALVATCSNQGVARLLDAKTLAERRTLERGRDGVHALAFSPDGRLLAVGTGVGAVLLFDLDGLAVKGAAAPR